MAKSFLIGFGERLVEPIHIKAGGGKKIDPYSYGTALQRQRPMWSAVRDALSSLPDIACPDDDAVFNLVLHPAYLAKTYFPSNFLDRLNFRSVGSKAVLIRPEKSLDRKHPDSLQLAPQLFVAASRRDLQRFASNLDNWAPDAATSYDFQKFEKVDPLDESRVRPIDDQDDPTVTLEVVLHASALEDDEYILTGFERFLRAYDAKCDMENRFHAGGLCFVPVEAPYDSIEVLGDFSFLRVARKMPILRSAFRRAINIPNPFEVMLPDSEAIDRTTKVAIFDGGISSVSPLSRWVSRKRLSGTGNTTPELTEHGTSVSSAFLFGPLTPGEPAPRPYANVDHWRVLDEDVSQDDSAALFTVLRRIISILSQTPYELVNISIGPDLPVEDDDVHVWTAVLDDFFSSGHAIVTAAVGNDGRLDHASGNARLKPPADGVNILAIGAADRKGEAWARADYSCIGPGRSPGFIKPDLLAFGGCIDEPFFVLSASGTGEIVPETGTSYAAPFVLRSAAGIKAHFGDAFSPITIRSLLLHHSDPSDHSLIEVGWGRLPTDIAALVTSDTGEAHVVYQGVLPPSQWLRMPIPLPAEAISGKVRIKATFCFASPIDPQDPLNYTRAGLEITFRPKTTGPVKAGKTMHPSSSFFQASSFYATEDERRRDAHKWETCLKAERTFFGSSLASPVFDVNYHFRYQGRRAARADSIPYALVVTIAAPSFPNLHSRILARYRTQLEVIQPRVGIPIRI